MPECNAVPVRRSDAEIANAPWLVSRMTGHKCALRKKFREDLIDVFNQRMREPRVIARFLGGHLISAFAQHHLEIAE